MGYDGISRGNVEGRLAGKIVCITGMGGGQGLITARLFARAGATVVGCDWQEAGVENARKVAADEGLSIEASIIDAADSGQARVWIDAAAERHGGIDVLYNNAGALKAAPIASMTDEEWRDTLRNELDIAFYPARAVWPHMVRRGGGSIISIASLSAMRGLEYGGYVAHCAAKGGVVAMTRQLAMEGAPHFIRANAISPGPVLAPGLDEHAGMAELRRGVSGWTILPRLGTGEDIAYGGLYLASDESLWLTGHNLVIDGGMAVKAGFTEHAGNRAEA